MTVRIHFFFILAIPLLLSCSGKEARKHDDFLNTNWKDIEQKARGTTVNFMMWRGDPLINQYVEGYVKTQLKKQYDINLVIANGQGSQIVSTIMAEIEAGAEHGQIDMMWINGETFYQLRQIGGLLGPFTGILPNSRFIDWQNPFIRYDFQQEIKGYECPWGNVQFSLIYNSLVVKEPPKNMEQLAQWVSKNPGKFTWSYDFTGMTLLKSWMAEIAAGDSLVLTGEFEEEKYNFLSKQLWAYIEKLKPNLWREGRTFPSSIAQMHQLFANGELAFTMSNNDAEVDNKILQGAFSETSRAHVLEGGTIRNSHYLGISSLASNPYGAAVAINFMISPEAQFEKMKPEVWGDGTVIDPDKLEQDWQKKFNNIPNRKYAPSREEIEPFALMEPAPEYMIRLFADFQKHIIE